MVGAGHGGGGSGLGRARARAAARLWTSGVRRTPGTWHLGHGTWHLAPADLRCCLPEAESRRRNARPTSRARNVEDSGERVLVLVEVRAREALLGVLTGTRMCEEQLLHKHCTL